MNIPILYEDADMLAINKPAGLMVHSDGKYKGETLVDWILEKYPDIKDIGEPLILSDGTEIQRPGIVHRLDRDTTGVLVIAKTARGFKKLKKQFHDRQAKKVYRAFVYGEIKDDRGRIDRPIGRSPKDFRRWSAQRGARGELREACTDYSVLQRAGGYSFVEARPLTGRTHQIRVHFKAINYPIVGDVLYSGKKENALGFERPALHAFRLVLESPSGKKLELEAPYPEDFDNALKILRS